MGDQLLVDKKRRRLYDVTIVLRNVGILEPHNRKEPKRLRLKACYRPNLLCAPQQSQTWISPAILPWQNATAALSARLPSAATGDRYACSSNMVPPSAMAPPSNMVPPSAMTMQSAMASPSIMASSSMASPSALASALISGPHEAVIAAASRPQIGLLPMPKTVGDCADTGQTAQMSLSAQLVCPAHLAPSLPPFCTASGCCSPPEVVLYYKWCPYIVACLAVQVYFSRSPVTSVGCMHNRPAKFSCVTIAMLRRFFRRLRTHVQNALWRHRPMFSRLCATRALLWTVTIVQLMVSAAVGHMSCLIPRSLGTISCRNCLFRLHIAQLWRMSPSL